MSGFRQRGRGGRCMPDEKSVATLFRRFRTSHRGGNGFTSLNDSAISVSCSAVFAGRDGSAAATPACPFDFVSDMRLDRLDAAHLRLSRTCWYVRLRSRRQVSRKKNTKSTTFAQRIAAGAQNDARQPNACVNTPPSIGPRDGPSSGAA